MSKKLLAEAGKPNGRDMPVIQLKTIPIYAELGAFVASSLKNRYKVQVETATGNPTEEIAKSKALFFCAGRGYPDAENYLSVFYSRIRTTELYPV
jgi:hypothetical protein